MLASVIVEVVDAVVDVVGDVVVAVVVVEDFSYILPKSALKIQDKCPQYSSGIRYIPEKNNEPYIWYFLHPATIPCNC